MTSSGVRKSKYAVVMQSQSKRNGDGSHVVPEEPTLEPQQVDQNTGSGVPAAEG